MGWLCLRRNTKLSRIELKRMNIKKGMNHTRLLDGLTNHCFSIEIVDSTARVKRKGEPGEVTGS